MANQKPVYAVFSGGGVKAAAFVGAWKEAQPHLRLMGVGGTSAGAIFSTLIACGYTPADLSGILFDAPYDKFFKRHWAKLFFNRNGLFSSTPLLTWLRKLIAAKWSGPSATRVTFRDLLSLKGGIPLKIVATNVNTQELQVFSASTSADFEVAQAVLASCSFPVVFPPVKYGQDHLIDGGVMSNFPMWLFDEEREASTDDPAPVVGFALSSSGGSNQNGAASDTATRFFRLVDAILVAQDRVQEKYLGSARLANVIRINIPPTATFSGTLSQPARDALILAGKSAAQEYLFNAPQSYEDRVGAPGPFELSKARTQQSKHGNSAGLSCVVRHHILKGGVARDSGLGSPRRLVRYYIDLMEAATDPEKRLFLSELLADTIRKAKVDFTRVIGIKRGNILLAATTADLLKKPFAIVTSDTSYKMGPPFEGSMLRDDKVILIDDIASDASILLHAYKQLLKHNAKVAGIFTLLVRSEGDPLSALPAQCAFQTVCTVGDTDIENLIERNKYFQDPVS